MVNDTQEAQLLWSARELASYKCKNLHSQATCDNLILIFKYFLIIREYMLHAYNNVNEIFGQEQTCSKSKLDLLI